VPTPIDPKRLPGLKKALADYGEDEWVPQQQLADLYGVANSRFTTLAKQRFPDFPAFERRGDKTHWFPARAAIKSMIQYMQDQARGKQSQAKRHSQVMSGVKEVQDEAAAAAIEETPLTATEIDRLITAQTKQFRLDQMRGMYVLRAEVERDSRAVLSLLSREVMNIINVLDPNGELPAEMRKRITDKSREVLSKMADGLAAHLREDDVAPPNASGNGAMADRHFERRRSGRGPQSVAGAA